MKKYTKIILAITIITLLSSNITIITTAETNQEKNYQRIHLDEEKILKNNTNIQQAINQAEKNDTIIIKSGSYNDKLYINKSIKIIGEENTIINGKGNDHIIEIQSENVTVENLILKNSGGNLSDSAVIIKSDNVTIKNCEIYKNKQGVLIQNSNFTFIKNSKIHHNGQGIKATKSENIKISECYISNNSIGIEFQKVKKSMIKKSFFTCNGLSCFFEKCEKNKFIKCNINKNSDNHGGIFLTENIDTCFENCYFFHNGIGLNLNGCSNIFLRNSSFIKNTHFAIKIEKNSQNINFYGCEIKDNLRLGVYVVENSVCKICFCNIFDNYLYSLKAKNSCCDIKQNYWGRFFGPSLFFIRKHGRIKFGFCNIKFFPWSFFELESSGINWEPCDFFVEKPMYSLDQKTINFDEVDSDMDGVPDWWEEKWGYDPLVWDDHYNLDPDCDGLNNVEECFTDKWGSNPYKKDVFLEIDWVHIINPEDCSNKPSWSYLSKIREAFAEKDIFLHIDLGELGGGEEIPLIRNFSFSKLSNIYWNYFLHNDLDNPRKGIFHYGLICNSGPDVNFPFIGWYGLDSFLVSAEKLVDKVPLVCKEKIIAGASMHQLGSTLGLLSDIHKGNDNIDTLVSFSFEWFRFRNYRSCMNYYYKFKILDYSDGVNGLGDFDDWSNVDLSFFKKSIF